MYIEFMSTFTIKGADDLMDFPNLRVIEDLEIDFQGVQARLSSGLEHLAVSIVSVSVQFSSSLTCLSMREFVSRLDP